MHTCHDAELARSIVEAAGSRIPLELAEDPVLGYVPQKGEFLNGLIERALVKVRRLGRFLCERDVVVAVKRE